MIFAALIVVQIMFGLNYVISKIVVEAFPPLVWASIRIIVASVIMFSVAFLTRRKSAPKSSVDFFGPLMFYALLGIIINQGAFLVGLHYTTSTNSAVLNTLIPVFTLAIVTIRGQEPLTARRGIGFAFAFAGVLVIRKVENFSLSDQTLTGDLLTILNCLSYGLFLSFSKKFLEKNDRVWTTAWMFIYGSFGLTFLALPDWLQFKMPEMSPRLLGCMVFAILGGTLTTYFLNMWALARMKSSSVAIFIYLQPIVASLLAYFWLGEPITLRTMFATALIFAGMLLSIQKPETLPARASK